MFAFLPERLGEVQIVRSWYPDGQPREFRDPSGGPLLTTYEVKQA